MKKQQVSTMPGFEDPGTPRAHKLCNALEQRRTSSIEGDAVRSLLHPTAIYSSFPPLLATLLFSVEIANNLNHF
jgi:hypothetical protein